MTELTAKVVKILNGKYKLAINKGFNDGIKSGMEFRIYETTEELFDPDTEESLGKLLISKGDGTVIDVQETMSIIRSNNTSYEGLTGAFASIIAGKTLTLEPFDNPQIGDYAKLINIQNSETEPDET